MTATAPAATLDANEHRRIGVDLFNRPHAEPFRIVTGEWQCSRVYAVLGRAEPSLWHARRALAMAREVGERVADPPPQPALEPRECRGP